MLNDFGNIHNDSAPDGVDDPDSAHTPCRCNEYETCPTCRDAQRDMRMKERGLRFPPCDIDVIDTAPKVNTTPTCKRCESGVCSAHWPSPAPDVEALCAEADELERTYSTRDWQGGVEAVEAIDRAQQQLAVLATAIRVEHAARVEAEREREDAKSSLAEAQGYAREDGYEFAMKNLNSVPVEFDDQAQPDNVSRDLWDTGELIGKLRAWRDSGDRSVGMDASAGVAFEPAAHFYMCTIAERDAALARVEAAEKARDDARQAEDSIAHTNGDLCAELTTLRATLADKDAELAAAREELEDAPKGLELLAEYLNIHDAITDNTNDEVQRDLRMWAIAIRRVLPTKEASDVHQ